MDGIFKDTMGNMKWTDIHGINAHGDIEHSIALIEAFKEVNEKLDINARYTFSQNIMHHYGLNGDETYIW